MTLKFYTMDEFRWCVCTDRLTPLISGVVTIVGKFYVFNFNKSTWELDKLWQETVKQVMVYHVKTLQAHTNKPSKHWKRSHGCPNTPCWEWQPMYRMSNHSTLSYIPHCTMSGPTFLVEVHGNYTQLNRLMMMRTSPSMCHNSMIILSWLHKQLFQFQWYDLSSGSVRKRRSC